MAIKIVDQFEVGAGSPIDTRLQKPTVSEAHLIPSAVRYVGMEVFIVGENKKYWFKDGIANTDLVEFKTGTEYANATTTTAGLMSAEDKTKLNAIGDTEFCVTQAQRDRWNDTYTKSETDTRLTNLEQTMTTGMDWKESVDNLAAIATTYPTPADGWTVNVKDTDITYRYDGAAWIAISANSIPMATTSLDGKMSAADKLKLDNMTGTTYQNDNPTMVTVGGIAAGTTFATAQSVQDVITAMLYPYKAPTASLSSNPSAIQERGVAVNSTVLNIGTTKQSRNITTVSLSRGGTQVYTPTTILPNGGSYSYTDTTPLTATTSWSVTVGDGQSAGSANASLTFVDPYFIGVSANAVVNNQTGLTKVVAGKQNITNSFTSSGYIVLFVPADWGNLVSIIDQNNFNVTSGYAVSLVNLTVASGTVSYRRILKTEPAVISGSFSLTFRF